MLRIAIAATKMLHTPIFTFSSANFVMQHLKLPLYSKFNYNFECHVKKYTTFLIGAKSFLDAFARTPQKIWLAAN
jgi:hypothetical protein